MSQTITFSKAVQQLYFNIDIKNASVEALISEFGNIAVERNVSKRISSLSVNLEMDMSGNARKVSYLFKFNKSPLPDMSIDTGHIMVNIGEVGSSKKIIDIDWCFQFLNKNDAKKFFECKYP